MCVFFQMQSNTVELLEKCVSFIFGHVFCCWDDVNLFLCSVGASSSIHFIRRVEQRVSIRADQLCGRAWAGYVHLQ